MLTLERPRQRSQKRNRFSV